ncbi:MAG: hypothetical protein ACLS48_05380, partial [[Eubacterium] siraeum]
FDSLSPRISVRGLIVRKSTVKLDFAGRKNRAYRLSVPICSVLLKISDIIALRQHIPVLSSVAL